MGKEIIGDGRAESARVLDGTVQVDRVPMDDRGGDEAQAGGAKALRCSFSQAARRRTTMVKPTRPTARSARLAGSGTEVASKLTLPMSMLDPATSPLMTTDVMSAVLEMPKKSPEPLLAAR